MHEKGVKKIKTVYLDLEAEMAIRHLRGAATHGFNLSGFVRKAVTDEAVIYGFDRYYAGVALSPVVSFTIGANDGDTQEALEYLGRFAPKGANVKAICEEAIVAEAKRLGWVDDVELADLSDPNPNPEI